jgi:hypothetical protein
MAKEKFGNGYLGGTRRRRAGTRRGYRGSAKTAGRAPLRTGHDWRVGKVWK